MAKNRLKELRGRSRLARQEVRRITGFGVSTISRHESGGRGLTEDAILKYAALYKVPTHQLFINPNEEEEIDNDGE